MGLNRVKKIFKEDAENIITSLKGEGFTFENGLNKVSFERKVNRCTMSVNFSVVYPVFQIEKPEYCFFVQESVEVTGLGSKTHGQGIMAEVQEMFDEKEVKLEQIQYQKDRKDLTLLSGFSIPNSDIGKTAGIYKAKYATIKFYDFQSEKDVDCVNEDSNIKIEFSDEQSLVRYFTSNTQYGYREESITMLNKDGLFRCLGDMTDNQSNYSIRHYHELTYIDETDKLFIIDSKNRIWQRIAFISTADTIQGSYERDGVDYLIVVNDSLYSLLGVTNSRIDTDSLLLCNGNLYEKENGATVLFPMNTPVPLFDTNIPSYTTIRGKGLYSSVRISGTKIVIVPLDSTFVSSYIKSKFEVAVVGRKIHAVVGNVENIGFGYESYGFNSELRVMERPENEHSTFFECFNDIGAKKSSVKIRFYDTTFEYKAPDFEVGDEVIVVKEPTFDSAITGLKGEIIEISNNKTMLTLRFFNLFELKIEIDKIIKA